MMRTSEQVMERLEAQLIGTRKLLAQLDRERAEREAKTTGNAGNSTETVDEQ